MPLGLFLLWTSIFWLTAVWDLGIRELHPELQRAARPGGVDAHLPGVRYASGIGTPLSRVEGRQGVREAPCLCEPCSPVPSCRCTRGSASCARPRVCRSRPHASAVPFLYMFVLLGSTITLLARMDLLRRAYAVRTQVVLFLAFGFLITTWRFWRDQFWGAADDTFPLEAGTLRPRLRVADPSGAAAAGADQQRALRGDGAYSPAGVDPPRRVPVRTGRHDPARHARTQPPAGTDPPRRHDRGCDRPGAAERAGGVEGPTPPGQLAAVSLRARWGHDVCHQHLASAVGADRYARPTGVPTRCSCRRSSRSPSRFRGCGARAIPKARDSGTCRCS